MLGGDASRINNLDIFKKAGVIGKTIVYTNSGGRTEDMKLFTIDFDNWLNEDIGFEDSQIFDYFANHQFLCIQYKETVEGDILKSQFVGFNRISFSQDFIYTYAKWIWEQVRTTVLSGNLRETIVLDKNGNPQRNKKTGTIKTSINLPKSSDNMKLFVRGTGDDSTKKPFSLCGIDMYFQQVWIKGLEIVNLLK